jgi:hypothetical protein
MTCRKNLGTKRGTHKITTKPSSHNQTKANIFFKPRFSPLKINISINCLNNGLMHPLIGYLKIHVLEMIYTLIPILNKKKNECSMKKISCIIKENVTQSQTHATYNIK